MKFPKRTATVVIIAAAAMSTMFVSSAHAGEGTHVGACGRSVLLTKASAGQYQLQLLSTQGVITGGFYEVETDGFGALPQPGVVNASGKSIGWNSGWITIFDRGINPSIATVVGEANTAGGPCTYSIVAPWNDK